MRSEFDRDGGVTYVGPRAFVAGFAIVCVLFVALLYAASRYVESLEVPPPIATIDVRATPSTNVALGGLVPNALHSATPGPIVSMPPSVSATATAAAVAGSTDRDTPIALASPPVPASLARSAPQPVMPSATTSPARLAPQLIMPSTTMSRARSAPQPVMSSTTMSPGVKPMNIVAAQDSTAVSRNLSPKAGLRGSTPPLVTSPSPKSFPSLTPSGLPAAQSVMTVGLASRQRFTQRVPVHPPRLAQSPIELTVRKPAAVPPLEKRTRPMAPAAIAIENISRPLTAVARPRTVSVPAAVAHTAVAHAADAHATVAHAAGMRSTEVTRTLRRQNEGENEPGAAGVTMVSRSSAPGLLVPFKAASALSPNTGLEPRTAGEAPIIVRPAAPR